MEYEMKGLIVQQNWLEFDAKKISKVTSRSNKNNIVGGCFMIDISESIFDSFLLFFRGYK
jgi:hypothetical protein